MKRPGLRSAKPILSAYAFILGVSPPKRVSQKRFSFEKSEGSTQEHPGVYPDIGFDEKNKKVLYVGRAIEAMPFLPHEITHCVWPERVEGPEDEWESGMICFELAWLERLCTTRWSKEWLVHWADYASEGRPGLEGEVDVCRRQAKKAVLFYGLPDPWADELPSVPLPVHLPEKRGGETA
jgi:hypothetical protein